jgi:hypothetical protein
MKTTKLLCLFSFLVFGFNPALGQFIQVGANTLSFGVLSENRIDSLPILLRNPTDRLAQFRLKFPLRIYGSQPYSVSDTSGSIPAGGQKTIWVRCSISHNTAQPGALIIQTFWPLPGGLLPGGETQVRLQAQGRYSKTYYSGTENKAEEELKSILKNRLAQNYNGFSYDVARDKMYGSIDNKNDSVTCVYTGRKARFNTRNGANIPSLRVFLGKTSPCGPTSIIFFLPTMQPTIAGEISPLGKQLLLISSRRSTHLL